MSAEDQPNSGEYLLRGLLRLPSELTGPFARLHQDKDDYVRKLEYRQTGLPENGISTFRKIKFTSSADFYARLKTKKPIGYSESQLADLIEKGIKYKTGGENNEHVSLRCPDCNMIELDEGICKPAGKASYADCQLFDKTDPFELTRSFKEQEAPEPRTPSNK